MFKIVSQYLFVMLLVSFIFAIIGFEIVEYIHKRGYDNPEQIDFSEDYGYGMLLLGSLAPSVGLGLLFGYILSCKLFKKKGGPKI